MLHFSLYFFFFSLFSLSKENIVLPGDTDYVHYLFGFIGQFLLSLSLSLVLIHVGLCIFIGKQKGGRRGNCAGNIEI